MLREMPFELVLLARHFECLYWKTGIELYILVASCPKVRGKNKIVAKYNILTSVSSRDESNLLHCYNKVL